jgi:hypothetical protein
MQPPNPLKNVYWGDTHVHTHESFDATLFGTTLTIEDAYRFARGEALRSDGGERMQRTRPLDFVARGPAFPADASLPDDPHTRTLRQNAAFLTYPHSGRRRRVQARMRRHGRCRGRHR